MLFLTACSGQKPDNLGPHDGRLAACPDTPNCVSSQSDKEDAATEPLPIIVNIRESMACLVDLLQKQDRCEIKGQTPEYIHATFRSRVFGFVDDVEFLVDKEQDVIHVRSAARVGYSDLGVNRARVQRLRESYIKACRQ